MARVFHCTGRLVPKPKMTIKTILAPNAPWYTAEELVWPEVVVTKKQPYVPRKIEKRTHRAKPSTIDKKFEEWLNSLEKIK